MGILKKNKELFNWIITTLIGIILIISLIHVGSTENAPPITHLSVSINSNPEGADIIFDGNIYGITPMDIPISDQRTHLIYLELNGYDSWKKEYNASLDSNKICASLNKTEEVIFYAPTPHLYLSINSNPEGADIVLDGTNYGITPLDIPISDQQTHLICLELNGYDSWKKEYNASLDSNEMVADLHKVDEITPNKSVEKTASSTEKPVNGLDTMTIFLFLFIFVSIYLIIGAKN